MGTPVNQRVQKRREALRAQGLRPVQMWLPDTRSPDFVREARRQSLIVAAANSEDADLRAFTGAAVEDLIALDDE